MTIPDAPLEALLRATAGAAPDAETILTEVRTDARLPYQPLPFPVSLTNADMSYGTLVLWHVDLAWSVAQKVQLWLAGEPGPGSLVEAGTGGTREVALSKMIAGLKAESEKGEFARYIGTFLATDVAHARYTVAIGLHKPVTRDAYEAAWVGAITALEPKTSESSWYSDVLSFLRMMTDQPTHCVQFLQLASLVGDLKQTDNNLVKGRPRYPTIDLLLP